MLARINVWYEKTWLNSIWSFYNIFLLYTIQFQHCIAFYAAHQTRKYTKSSKKCLED